jgi:hypothetical protein
LEVSEAGAGRGREGRDGSSRVVAVVAWLEPVGVWHVGQVTYGGAENMSLWC